MAGKRQEATQSPTRGSGRPARGSEGQPEGMRGQPQGLGGQSEGLRGQPEGLEDSQRVWDASKRAWRLAWGGVGQRNRGTEKRRNWGGRRTGEKENRNQNPSVWYHWFVCLFSSESNPINMNK